MLMQSNSETCKNGPFNLNEPPRFNAFLFHSIVRTFYLSFCVTLPGLIVNKFTDNCVVSWILNLIKSSLVLPPLETENITLPQPGYISFMC